MKVTSPDGGTFSLVRSLSGEDDVALTQRLLEDAGVVVVPGSAFGQAGHGFVRVSFGNQPVERIVEATRRIVRLG